MSKERAPSGAMQEPLSAFAVPIGAVVVLAFVNWTSQGFERSIALLVPPLGERVPIVLSNATISLGERSNLVATTPDGVEFAMHDIAFSIPGLFRAEETSSASLLEGVKFQTDLPDQVGMFKFLITSNNVAVAEAPIVVVDPNLSVPIDQIFGEIGMNEAIVSSGGGVNVPIFVTLKTIRDGVPVPVPAPSSANAVIRDAATNEQVITLTIAKGEAISNVGYVPLKRGTNKLLKGSISFGEGSQTLGLNPIQFDWQNFGPEFRLAADFATQEAYASGITKATVQTYLTIDGTRRIRPFEAVPVSIQKPVDVRYSPASIELNEKQDIVRCDFRTSTKQRSEIVLKENSYGSETKVTINFIGTEHFYLYAFAGSVIALGATRWAHYLELWKKSWITCIFELIGIVVGTLVIFGLYLEGLIPELFADAMPLGTASAIAVGIAGGMLGLGVFKVIANVVGISG